MAKIKSPAPGFTGIVVGVSFQDGKAETEEQGALNYFQRHGYTIEAPEAPAYPAEGTPGDSWTVDQLRAYAKDKGIELKGSKKAELIAELAPATATKADGTEAKTDEHGTPELEAETEEQAKA